jgi:hypothetical protein
MKKEQDVANEGDADDDASVRSSDLELPIGGR